MENGLELRRQLFHLALGVLVIALLMFDLINFKVLLFVFFVGLIISLLSLRFKVPLIRWFLHKFERKDYFPGKGALFFVLGCVLVLVLFPKDVALASIAILTFGDSIGPLVGVYFGRRKSRVNNRRFVEGFVAAFVISFFAALFFVPWVPAFLGTFFALAYEFLEFSFQGYSVDDNLLIPLISGAVMFLVMML